jgi:prophage tail gpP-like protein
MGTPKPFVQTPLGTYLQKNGRFPLVSLHIQPIDASRSPVVLTQFEEYSFQSSVLVPVDSFSFTARNPTLAGSLYDFIRDGDIATLIANGVTVATGLIDTVTIATDPDSGEMIHISGRTLIAQLEDQSAINDTDDPIWGNGVTVEQAVNALINSTRINFYRLQQAPSGSFLFATEPGESKLSALQRYIEPLNCIVWMDPDGTIAVGRPDMGASSTGTFVMDRQNRIANCLSIQASYSSTQIPNVVLPVWTGQETVQSRVAPEQAIYNKAQGPSRLFKNDHRVPKSVVVSTPSGADPQSLSAANQIVVAGSNILQAYAKREIARANVHEVGVQVNIQGHYNQDLTPILVDSTYIINYPRASLNEKMYLHTVAYSLNRTQGQRTSLSFCRLGCIVADAAVRSVKASTVKQQASGAQTS